MKKGQGGNFPLRFENREKAFGDIRQFANIWSKVKKQLKAQISRSAVTAKQVVIL